MKEIKENSVLIAPLNWGIGHATRCVPIINYYLKSNKKVILASSGVAYDFLKSRFPSLKIYLLSDYPVKYGNKGAVSLSFFQSLFGVIQSVSEENKETKEIIKKERIELVISDNRYGVYSSQVKSIFLGHQLSFPNLFFNAILNKIHAYYINRFDEVWIPDTAKRELTGKMSENKFLKVESFFIGPISQLVNTKKTYEKVFEFLILVSGQEPLNKNFLYKALQKINLETQKVVVVGEVDPFYKHKNIVYKGFVDSVALEIEIKKARSIIAVSGYSTIMDLAVMDVLGEVDFIPTPRQPEQKYLSLLHKKKPFKL